MAGSYTTRRRSGAGGKADGDAMLLEEGATDMQLSHIVLSDSGASGLHLMGGGSEQVTTSHFYDNAEYGVFFDGSGSRTKITTPRSRGRGRTVCTSIHARVRLPMCSSSGT